MGLDYSMRKFWPLFAMIVGLTIIGGCNSTEVSSEDVKGYQNAGRDADDPPVDPNTGQPVGE